MASCTSSSRPEVAWWGREGTVLGPVAWSKSPLLQALTPASASLAGGLLSMCAAHVQALLNEINDTSALIV